MDDIAGEMCISKKTIYKYFCNKKLLVEESTTLLHKEIHETNDTIQMNYNAIEENFKIRKMFSEMFKSSADTSHISIKKNYPEIYAKVMLKELTDLHVVQTKYSRNR
jgi:hypothetical protein